MQLGSINSQPVLAQGTLKVTNIPSFVTQDDFGRLFAQLEGCISATLMGRQPTGDQVGFVEFSDKMNASKAKNLYQGWNGWGGRGLNVEFAAPAPAQQQAPGQKRGREGEDAYQQAGGNYKQQRADGAPMGMGGQMGAPGLQQDTTALLQQVSAGMLSGLMQSGMGQQLMAQAPQQVQAPQGAGTLQSAGIAAGLAGGGSTPTGQQILQQGLGQAGPQQGQQAGATLGMLAAQQQAQQGAQAGGQAGQQGQMMIPGITGMGGVQAAGGAGQQQDMQGGAYFTTDNMARLASSLAGGQMGQVQQQAQQQQYQQNAQSAQQAQQQQQYQQNAQSAQQAQQQQQYQQALQQAQQQAQQLAGQAQQAQQLASMQAQLPAGYTLQPGTVLLQPTSGGGYQQIQPGQVYQMAQQAQQLPQSQPQQAQQAPMQPQYLQQGQPTILQPGQIQVAGAYALQPGPGGVISQPGMAQTAAMAPIPVQQAPPGATIIQPQQLPSNIKIAHYPHDACPTLYAEGFPEDTTKRELGHIFRPFEGFKGIRFVVKDSKKHVGEKLVMAFIEFSNTYFASECMNALQGYPLDLDDPNAYVMRIKYARPLDNPPRPAGPGRGEPYGGPGGRGGGGRGEPFGGRGGGRGDYGGPYGGGRGRGRGPPPMDDRRDRRDDRDRR